jgi:hypothetical protein
MQISWTDKQHPEISNRIQTNSTFHCEEANKETGQSQHLFPITAWLLKEATLKNG